jgi:hypothetical protein
VGTGGYQGAFARYSLTHEDEVLALPDGLTLRQAALAEPLAVALHGITQARVEPGHRVIVFGAGPIGALTTAALAARGVTHLTVVEPTPSRQALAMAVGATRVVTPDELDAPGWHPGHLIEGPYDRALECSGNRAAMEQALGQLGRMGRLVLVGAGIPREIPGVLDDLYFYEGPLGATFVGQVPTITVWAPTAQSVNLVRFDATLLGSDTAGSFSLYFDGSDVGLTTTGEDVDAVEVLTGGTLVVSTLNTVSANGAAGEDEDLLAFAPTSLGPNTAGSFSLYFDGSDVQLTASGEDVDAAAVGSDGRIHLSTLSNFAVTGASGADEDDVVFTSTSLGDTTAGTYSSPVYFDGSVHGLSANDVNAIDLP